MVFRRSFMERALTTLLVLLGVSFLMFSIARVIPGDPARIALGPRATPEAVAALQQKLHLDEPFLVQYGYFLRDLARGDLGMSLYTNRPVMTDIGQFLPATLELVLVSAAMMMAIGIPLGILSARYRDTAFDHATRLFILVIISLPSFVCAVILMLVFAYFLPVFPVAGQISDSFDVDRITGFLLVDTLLQGNVRAFLDVAWHIVLPALALALGGIGQAARLIRANMAETYKKPYIEMAEAYGVPARRIANRYAFRPSLIPSLTIIGLDVASMLGNAFLIEAVFAWPGLSRYGVAVILRKDLNAIVGTGLVIAVMFLVINLFVDFLVSVINPRIRLSQRAS